MADAPIQYIAHRAALSGLNLRQARDLFDALYIADALHIAKGNTKAAAAIAGVNSESLCRIGRLGRTNEDEVRT